MVDVAAGEAPPLRGASPPAGRQPRLGYVLATFPGLTETFVLREIDGLRRLGFSITVLAIKRADHPQLQRSLLEAGPPPEIAFARPDRLLRHFAANLRALVLHPRAYMRSLGVFARELGRVDPVTGMRLLYHFFCGIGFVGEVRRRGIEHLHAHFSAGCNIALAASLFSGVPFSFTAHASGDLFVEPVLLRQKLGEARFAIAVCDYSRKYLDDVTGNVHSEKLTRIYNGIDAAEAAAALPAARSPAMRPDHSGDAGPFRIVSVGSLVGVKGHGTLVDACRLLQCRGHDVRCEIIGDGPERASLESRIAAAGLENVVTIAGFLPLGDVWATLARADVFALLSQISVSGYRDGFPTVILEAMVAGLPVVSTWISGIPELVADGVTGFLVHERDATAAADALERLARDPPLRRRMGQAGLRRARERFDFEELSDHRARLFRLHAAPPDPGASGTSLLLAREMDASGG